MGLQSDIVIVNEFSVPLPGGKGSRGATPGDYVTRYMARGNATESLAPIRKQRLDDFVLRYMARESAVEHASTRDGAKSEMRQAQGRGGVAFGYGEVSLSDEQLKAASHDIQHHFTHGKTVLKTVLSFDPDYLKRHGLVDPDFECRTAGDYRGHLDQMKLRMAIMHGLDRMARGHSGFDDLRYVGVIQVDTEHVHCHLAMVDAGTGHLAADGTQRGKLNERHKSRLRRGVDAWLDEKQTVRHLSSAVGYERRNVTTYIKRWAHERMQDESLSQFLLACLPQDRSLWRAGSGAAMMRKPNQIVHDLVTEQLARPGSPMPEAMSRVRAYADQRRETEHLDTTAWRGLVAAGQDRIIERAVNGVYGMLRALPADELTVRTPMLHVMGMDYERLALAAHDVHPPAPTGQDPDHDLLRFGFRLRGYSSRLEHHRDKHQHYRDLSRDWERADRAGVAVEASRPLYDFYRFEAEYNARLMAKYQHFLPFSADPSAWYDQQRIVGDYGRRMLSLIALRGDTALQRMKDPDQAERLGRDIYDQPGGRLLTMGRSGRAVLDERITTMRGAYEDKVEQLRSDLAGAGLVLVAEDPAIDRDADTDGHLPVRTDPRLRIEPGTAYVFEEVKALDLHHLGYDFLADVPIGAGQHRRFSRAAAQRRRLMTGAAEYLERSGQGAALSALPMADVDAMTSLAGELASAAAADGTTLLPSRLARLRAEQARQDAQTATTADSLRRSKAPSLDDDLVVRVRHEVDRAARLEPAAATSGFDDPVAGPMPDHEGRHL